MKVCSAVRNEAAATPASTKLVAVGAPPDRPPPPGSPPIARSAVTRQVRSSFRPRPPTRGLRSPPPARSAKGKPTVDRIVGRWQPTVRLSAGHPRLDGGRHRLEEVHDAGSPSRGDIVIQLQNGAALHGRQAVPTLSLRHGGGVLATTLGVGQEDEVGILGQNELGRELRISE